MTLDNGTIHTTVCAYPLDSSALSLHSRQPGLFSLWSHTRPHGQLRSCLQLVPGGHLGLDTVEHGFQATQTPDRHEPSRLGTGFSRGWMLFRLSQVGTLPIRLACPTMALPRAFVRVGIKSVRQKVGSYYVRLLHQ
ncbi:unnamed protein product [Protopolystoma xenopodis]|uniref:Uncharacterized protein n=1 Tax=Protopolystoma xenopodis TaxID=117903 RepID=A0A3S5ACQ1_9PLAT|nr:unnamed protein product [Protopolystoma xenopodis]